MTSVPTSPAASSLLLFLVPSLTALGFYENGAIVPTARQDGVCPAVRVVHLNSPCRSVAFAS